MLSTGNTQTDTTLLDQINKNVSLSLNAGCLLEYNMNEIIDGVGVSNSGGDTVTKTDSAGVEYQPFLKLFPITTIIDPRRPKYAGVKYFILNNNISETLVDYNVSKQSQYRLYYPGVKTKYKYWVSEKANGTSLSNCLLTVDYAKSAQKNAVANKITIKFETSHSKPTNWSVKIVKGTTETTISTNEVVPDNGVVNLYYSGTAWSTTEFETPSVPVDIDKIKVQVNSISQANEYLGVLEISARYVLDITDRIQSFSVSKQSSDNSNGLIPVGNVVANSISASINSYDRLVMSYDKTFVFDKNKVNLYKNVKILPYIKMQNGSGQSKINQGTYYMDSWSISDLGEVTLNGLDGAKFLQEIIAPNVLIKDAPSEAIIRRLLDGIGFTNYNFNRADNESSTVTPKYFYTNTTDTVWQVIQGICKDSQMIATFDENDILQFYTREKLFKSRVADFKFRSKTVGENLPNIISLTKTDLPSTKAVVVNYTPQLSSSYLASSQPLWNSGLDTLGAGALQKTLLKSAPAETDAPNGVIYLTPVATVKSGIDTKLTNQSGYLVINDEIIEYDAIKYQYVDLLTQTPKQQWITSSADVAKYSGLSKPNSFIPINQYRIKTRGAFNTVASDHIVDLAQIKAAWTVDVVNTKTKASSVDNTKISIQESDSSANQVTRSMLKVNSSNDDQIYVNATTAGKFTTTTTNPTFLVGTSFYFPATNSDPVVGGLSLCLDSNSKNGYYIKVQTTQNAQNVGNKIHDFRIIKIKDGVESELTDSQSAIGAVPITGVSSGELFRLDAKVQYKGGVAYFKISFNNTIVTTKDTSPLPLTQKVGLFANRQQVYFDYIYTAPLIESDYAKNETYNIYSGMLGSQSSLTQKFGDFVLTKNNLTKSPFYVLEFGPVAREIRKITGKYDQFPAYPQYPTLGINPFITILGSNLDPFEFEIYAINNAGTFIDIDNGQDKQFKIIGQSIVPTGPFSYIDPDLSATANDEQVAFDSTWIQTEAEAKALSTWMRTQWSKQQVVVDIEAFANPMLQVGDIIEISYPENSLYSTEDAGQTAGKYVILNVGQSWDQGLTTSITARSIYVG